MAGRPINIEQREMRKREVDAAIEILKRQDRIVTKKTIAEEMGISVQSLYGTGFLSVYISELESTGIVQKERGSASSLSAAEAKKLGKTVTSLQKEVKRLKEKVEAQEKILVAKDTEIEELVKQLEIERGNNFLKQKREFAQRRI